MNWYEFINEEYSKNDPIPEINRYDHNIGIILLGTPGAGKTTFVNNFILPKNKNFTKFSTDDISLKFTKDPNVYYSGKDGGLSASMINLRKLEEFIKTQRNFVYDTTGMQDKNIFKICELAKEMNYKILFIQILVDKETTKTQNKERKEKGGHFVDNDYIDLVYSKQFTNIKKYSELINPDGFYIVFNKQKKYKYFKYENGTLLKRKVDKYIPIKKDTNL